MKNIKDLINCDYDFLVSGITDDSRKVKSGYLFVATKGFNVDHFDYISDAVKNGAICVVSDRKASCDVPNIISENINDLFPKLCSKFYDVLPSEFNLIGITGTDGKTTTTTIVQRLISLCKKIACIGTNGMFIDDEILNTNNTTPCVEELYSDLKYVKDNKCKNIVMEVSSEALLHNRLKDFKFDIVGFTNITEDHLNVHKTIENYRNCKFKLLDLVSDNGFIVANGDDSNCRLINKDNLITFGVNRYNDYIISDVNEVDGFVNFTLWKKDIKYEISSPLCGKYNVYNVSMAFIICLLSGIDSDLIIENIKLLKPINGRREHLNFGQRYEIILDYAHTYNGIKSLVESFNKNKIIVVTGAAGGREKEKRRKIGSYLLNNCDTCIFTMDDPRYESVDEIIDQMVGKSKKKYYRVIDRKDAIYKAFELADNDSVILIIGKGRDNYMAIDDKKIPYCDYDVVENYFKKRHL